MLVELFAAGDGLCLYQHNDFAEDGMTGTLQLAHPARDVLVCE
ncbi:MAG TPA: hypothetical protein VD789_11040 [Thermomicrobiales bacterium]|nr:hypothetical protein [Thermomicrobiales bacterium]